MSSTRERYNPSCSISRESVRIAHACGCAVVYELDLIDHLAANKQQIARLEKVPCQQCAKQHKTK